jgi:hypothetical protein
MDNELDLTNTGVFKAIGTPHLPPGPLMVAEAAASATMLEQDRKYTPSAAERERSERQGDLIEMFRREI